jgi:hypothetical protein
MLGNLLGNTWYVGRLPCEDIEIHLQEVHERFLLPRLECRSDAEGAPVVGYWHLFSVLRGLERARCSFGDLWDVEHFRNWLFGELVAADKRIRKVEELNIAFVRVLKLGADGDECRCFRPATY